MTFKAITTMNLMTAQLAWRSATPETRNNIWRRIIRYRHNHPPPDEVTATSTEVANYLRDIIRQSVDDEVNDRPLPERISTDEYMDRVWAEVAEEEEENEQ